MQEENEDFIPYDEDEQEDPSDNEPIEINENDTFEDILIKMIRKKDPKSLGE